MRFKTIFVATDFSDASDAAVEFASALTEQSGGSLHVLTVIPNAASAPWGLFGDRFSLTGTLEEWRRGGSRGVGRFDGLALGQER